jgi:hypothetical protein
VETGNVATSTFFQNDASIKPMARVKLPTCDRADPETANILTYGNGAKFTIRDLVCYGMEGIFDRDVFRWIFEREALRLMGPPPDSEKQRISDSLDLIVGLLGEENLGLFNKKVAGDETDWRAIATFANWYWWLTPEGLDALLEDIRNGNRRWAEYFINWVKPNMVKHVKDDPTYSSTDAVRTEFYRTPTFEKFDPYVHDPFFANLDMPKGLANSGAGPWPIALPSGLPASVPGLPPPCENFPACVLGIFPQAIEKIWDLVEAFAAANPSVKQVRSAEGTLYKPDPPPEEQVADNEDLGIEPSEKQGAAWPWLIGGALAMGAAIWLWPKSR